MCAQYSWSPYAQLLLDREIQCFEVNTKLYIIRCVCRKMCEKSCYGTWMKLLWNCYETCGSHMEPLEGSIFIGKKWFYRLVLRLIDLWDCTKMFPMVNIQLSVSKVYMCLNCLLCIVITWQFVCHFLTTNSYRFDVQISVNSPVNLSTVCVCLQVNLCSLCVVFTWYFFLCHFLTTNSYCFGVQIN